MMIVRVVTHTTGLAPEVSGPAAAVRAARRGGDRRPATSLSLYISIPMYIYIYIYSEREMYTSLSLSLYIYIYIHV